MVTETKVRPFRELLPDGTLNINLHSGQWKAYNSEARFIFLLGGTQVGKTCFGPHWLHQEIGRCGAGDYLATTSTYDLFKLKMLPELLLVFEQLLGIGRYWAGERIIELAENLERGNFKAHHQDDPMWGRIILRSAEAEGGLEAATAKAAWLDEVGQPQFHREAWEATLRRLSLAQGRLLGTTTLYGLGWLKSEVYDKWEAGDRAFDIIQVDSIANPAFPKEEYEEARKRLPWWKFQLFYKGQYAKPAGLIYDAFDEAACKIRRFPIPLEWPRYVGHDFGGANPAAMFYAQDPATGYFYAYEEYLPGSGRSTAEHVRHFKETTKEATVLRRVGGSHQEEGWRGDFTAQGWPIMEPRVRDVQQGIDRVYAMHRLNKLFVFDDLHNYLDEKLSYSRKLDSSNQPTEDIQDKARFHLMDAERYVLSDFIPEGVMGIKPVTKRSIRL